MAKRREDPGLLAILTVAGNFARIAERLGMSIQGVCRWRRVPVERVLEVESEFGIPREKLRPDLYAAPRPKRARPSAHV